MKIIKVIAFSFMLFSGCNQKKEMTYERIHKC